MYIKEINSFAVPVYIEGPVNVDYLKTLKMSDRMSYSRTPSRQHEALCIIADSHDGFVYIVRQRQEIIGYAAFHQPDSFTRWVKHPRVLELGGIEIHSKFKKKGLARELLKAAFSDTALEEYIVIIAEYSWHWDLKESGLGIWKYQKMLIKLYGDFGFKKRGTDDPEILEHPANMLMVRMGDRVPEAYIKIFEDMLYQQSIIE